MSALVLPLKRLFDWKVRGVRWVEIIGLVLVAAMIFGVYLAKAAAARQSSDIGALERQIASNGQRVRLLRAEVARLEQPGRLEALSRQAGLAPVGVERQATADALPSLVPIPEPRVIVAPTPIVPPAPVSPAASAPETVQ